MNFWTAESPYLHTVHLINELNALPIEPRNTEFQLRFGRVVANLCELSDRVYPEDACGSGKEIKGNVAMIWHTFAIENKTDNEVAHLASRLQYTVTHLNEMILKKEMHMDMFKVLLKDLTKNVLKFQTDVGGWQKRTVESILRAQKEEALFYFGEAKENRMVRKNKRMLEIAREFYPKLNIVKASFHKELSEKMENEVKEELKKETLEFETLRSTDNFCGFAYDVEQDNYYCAHQMYHNQDQSRFYTAFCPRGRDIDIIFGEHERRYNEMIKRVHEKNMEAGMYNDSIQMMEKVIKLLDRPTCVSEMLKIERFRNNVFEEKATWEECVEMLDWLDAIVRRPRGDMDVDLQERNIKLYCKRLWEIYEAACQQFYNKRSNSLMLLQEMVQKEGVQYLRFRFNKSVTSGLPKTTVWLCGYIQKVIKEKNLAELDEAKIKKIHAHAIMHIMAEKYMINPSTIPETLVNDVFRMYLMFMEFQFLVLAFSTYNSLAYDNPPSIFQPVVKYLADMPPSPSTKLLNKMLVFLEDHLEKQGMLRENINVKMSMVQNMQHSPVFSHVRERLVVLYLDHMEDKVVTHEIRKVNPLFHARLLASMDRVKEFARRDYVLHASPWYMDTIVQYLKSF